MLPGWVMSQMPSESLVATNTPRTLPPGATRVDAASMPSRSQGSAGVNPSAAGSASLLRRTGFAAASSHVVDVVDVLVVLADVVVEVTLAGGALEDGLARRCPPEHEAVSSAAAASTRIDRARGFTVQKTPQLPPFVTTTDKELR